jgi:2-phospho-L-lactate guanylyltransferase
VSAALVPVKRLDEGKSRLQGVLERHALERLTLAMLADLLEALRAAPEVNRVIVLTPDPAVAAAARAAGAEALERDDGGLNPALLRAGAELAASGVQRLLVVLGDVPGALPDEIGALFHALTGLGGRGVVLAPSRDGGTAALLRAPHDAIPPRFGEDSARAHRDLARALGVPFAEVALPSLALDVDRPEDLLSLSGPGATRTRALVGELAVLGKPAATGGL